MRTVIKVGDVTVDEEALSLGEDIRLVITAKIVSVHLMQTAASKRHKGSEAQYIELAGSHLGTEGEREATVERLDA